MRKWFEGIVCALLVLCGGAVSTEAATRTVCASGCAYTDLQAAINAAVFGDVILLRSGQTYVGHFTLRAKSGTGTITIRSDAADANFPADGRRLVPSGRPGANTSRSLLARIVGRGGTYKSMPLLRTEPGAHGYLIKFVEFDGAAQLGYETLVQLGDSTTAAPPYDITFDRVYVHGHPDKGQKRGLTLNGVRLTVVNSYISDIKTVGADSQAILGYNGAGPLTITNNYLEGSGENVMFGGAAPAVTNLVPSNIVLTRNHFFKPLQWRNAILSSPGSVRAAATTGGSLPSGTHYFRVVAVMTTAGQTVVSAPSAAVSATVAGSGAATVSWGAVRGADSYRVYRGTSATSQSVYLQTTGTSLTYKGGTEIGGKPTTSGHKWVVKNHLEFKNAAKVVVDANIFENSWVAGQVGYALVLTPRSSGNAPWTRVQDITITNNIVRHVSGVVNIMGYDSSGTTLRTERITFRNNLFYDVDATKYGNSTRAFLMGGGAAYVTFDRNTLVHTNSTVLVGYGASMPGFVFVYNSMQHQKYGINGDGSTPGNPTLTKYFPGAVVQCNALAGGSSSLYPKPNAFPTVDVWKASFIDPAADDYRPSAKRLVPPSGCTAAPGADVIAVNAATAGTLTGTPAAVEASAPTSPSVNQAPIADAGGPYAATVGSLLSVDGTASRDPEGSALDYVWHWGDEIVVRAGDLPSTAIRGGEWVRTTSGSAAEGVMLLNPDNGAAKRTAAAAPASYVEFTINAAAGVPYYLWMRLLAAHDSYGNDSLSLQFDGAVNASGTPLARIGTTSALAMILEAGSGAGVSGWGWTDAMYGGVAAPIYFAKSGPQKIRIQQREDGVAWDQLVLSSAAFPTAPGLAKKDTTIVDGSLGMATGVSATHRYRRSGVYPVLLVVTDAAKAVASDTATATIK